MFSGRGRSGKSAVRILTRARRCRHDPAAPALPSDVPRLLCLGGASRERLLSPADDHGGGVRESRQRDRGGELSRGSPAHGMGHQRLRRSEHPGVRNRHLDPPGRDDRVQDRHGLRRLPDRHLPHGLLRGHGRSPGGFLRAFRGAAPAPARMPPRADPGAGGGRRDGDVARAARRLRELGGVGLLAGTGGRDIRDLLRPARARGPDRGLGQERCVRAHAAPAHGRGLALGGARFPRRDAEPAARGARQPHLLRRPGRRRRIRPALPDLGSQLAGVQTAMAATACTGA